MKNAQNRLTVLAASVAALAMSMSMSATAATQGPADNSFYDAPAAMPSGNPGTLVSYRSTKVNLGANTTAHSAWNVTYKSTDAVDVENIVSGTVIVPSAAWSGTGPRPVVVYAVGTHGLGNQCAPSRQMAAGTDYEANNINAALAKGYAVLVSDYEGYLNGGLPTYLAGRSQAHAVLDMVRAAQQLNGAGITTASKVGVWGFSQGGQTSAWAAEVQKSYAPELNIVGFAAGGIPADFIKAAYFLDGSFGAAFLASGVSGLKTQYPDQLPVDLIASDSGLAALEKLQGQCVFEALLDLQNKSLSAFTKNNFGLDQILKVGGVKQTMLDQNLGTTTPAAPMYLFHGQADEFIDISQTTTLKNTYCASNKQVKFDLYPSEHIVTMTQGAGPALAWMADRFNGVAAQGNCSVTTVPASTSATTKGGDLIVNLDKWKLDAKIHLKTLNQDVILPDTSTLSVVSNISKNSMTGSMNVPDFKSRVSIIGINAQVGIRVTPVDKVTGQTSLDAAGQLTITGTAKTDITVTTVWGVPFGECKTVTPVIFPLSYKGSVGDLGAGKVTFTGTADFPQIKGCFISGIISAMMSTKGNPFTFTIAPPAPKSTY